MCVLAVKSVNEQVAFFFSLFFFRRVAFCFDLLVVKIIVNYAQPTSSPTQLAHWTAPTAELQIRRYKDTWTNSRYRYRYRYSWREIRGLFTWMYLLGALCYSRFHAIIRQIDSADRHTLSLSLSLRSSPTAHNFNFDSMINWTTKWKVF